VPLADAACAGELSNFIVQLVELIVTLHNCVLLLWAHQCIVQVVVPIAIGASRNKRNVKEQAVRS
jgi:hypothetical protein